MENNGLPGTDTPEGRAGRPSGALSANELGLGLPSYLLCLTTSDGALTGKATLVAQTAMAVRGRPRHAMVVALVPAGLYVIRHTSYDEHRQREMGHLTNGRGAMVAYTEPTYHCDRALD